MISQRPDGTSGLDAVEPVEVFTEVLESVTMSLYATDRQTKMSDVAREVLSVLGQFGWQLYAVEGPKVRRVSAIDSAKGYLIRSERAHEDIGANAAMAHALKGILTLMIEQQEAMFDAPCDCFAGEPKLKANDGPDVELWGGSGARG